MNESAENPVVKSVYLFTHAEKREKTWVGILLWFIFAYAEKHKNWFGILMGKLLTQWAWKYLFVADPGATKEGIKKIKNLQPEFNKLQKAGVSEYHCGTGRRQWEIAKLLGLKREDLLFSDAWGSGVTFIRILGINFCILTHGLLIFYPKQLLSTEHLSEAVKEAIRKLPDKAVIFSGRPVLLRLGLDIKKCAGGAIYRIDIHEDGAITIEPLTDGTKLPGSEEAARV